MNNTPVANVKFFGSYKDIRELRDKVLEYSKNSLSGKEIYNFSSKKRITLSWRGLKDDISHAYSFYEEKLLSFSVIESILSKAIFLFSENEKKGNSNIKIHKFASKVIVNGIEYDVWIVIKETNKTYLYDHGMVIK